MSRETGWAVLLLLSTGWAASPVSAQQQSVTVEVLNVQAQPAQPVKAVRVSLSYLDSAVLITDAQDVTNSQGEALLVVSAGAAQRGDLRIEIAGANNLVIWQPADGQLPSLGTKIDIRLLPKGSPALLGPAQIEAMLHRTLLQVSSLQKQNRVLKGQVAAAQSQAQNQQDLGAELAEFALATGFSPAQVQQQVQIWAQNIQLQSSQASTEQKALAEFALKNYAAAAQTFNQAADTSHDEIDATEAEAAALEKALLDKVRGQLRQLVSDREQAASAYQLNLQYHQATQTMTSAEATAQAEYKKHPGDQGFHELWLQALLSLANSRAQEGQVSPANDSALLITQAAGDFQLIAREYAALGDARQVADAYTGAGFAIAAEARRSTGDKATTLSDQSVQAFHLALDGLTRTQAPRDWALAQNGLGNVLEDEGERVGAQQSAPLLEEAVQAFRHALEVYTQADFPQYWAETQQFLGNAFEDEAERTEGDKAAALFDQSVQSFRNSLAVYTQTAQPRNWAVTQHDLAIALAREGESVGGDRAITLFDQSVQAFRSALQVFTQTALPQDWAKTQRNLGAILLDEGQITSGAQSVAFLDQAVQALHSALEVYTRADLPQDWAATQNNLGNALMMEALRSSGDRRAALLDQAVQAYQSALQVFTKADIPQEWARTENNLGDALAEESFNVSWSGDAALAAQAMEAYRRSLEVLTKAGFPEQWAQTQINLEEISLRTARFQSCLDQAGILTDDSLPPPDFIIRDSMKLACQWAIGNRPAALTTEKALSSRAGSLAAGFWDFSGTIRFVSASPAFQSGRPSWVALFTAVQGGDGPGMTAALHQLEPLLQN